MCTRLLLAGAISEAFVKDPAYKPSARAVRNGRQRNAVDLRLCPDRVAGGRIRNRRGAGELPGMGEPAIASADIDGAVRRGNHRADLCGLLVELRDIVNNSSAIVIADAQRVGRGGQYRIDRT